MHAGNAEYRQKESAAENIPFMDPNLALLEEESDLNQSDNNSVLPISSPSKI